MSVGEGFMKERIDLLCTLYGGQVEQVDGVEWSRLREEGIEGIEYLKKEVGLISRSEV